jgi:4-amino-4-deoxy-L-arabinose transferase-like glycosyltransferase
MLERSPAPTGFTFFPKLNSIRVNRSLEAALLTVILLAFLFVSLLLLSKKGLFIDDSMHIPAGYSYLLTHDYRLNQEHPPLIKLISALGLWRLHPQFPFDSPGWQQAATPGDPEDGMVRVEEAFFVRNAKQFEEIAFYARLPVLVVPLILLVTVWWFTRQLFGPIPALVATLFTATEPNIIGNSIVVQDDVAASLALLLFIIALKRFLTDGDCRTNQQLDSEGRDVRPPTSSGKAGKGEATHSSKGRPIARTGNALILGGALGLGLVTKYSLLVLLPVSLFILVTNGARQLIHKRSSLISVLLSSALVILTGYFILISFYAFHIDRIDEDESSIISSWFYLTDNTADLFESSLTRLPPLVPKYFVYGIDLVVYDTREGRPAFLLGQVSPKGWWYYFPVAFALKTTIPFLITSVCGMAWALFQVLKRKHSGLLYLVLPALLYLVLSMTSHLDIGVRHLLPMFPFVAITGAGFISAAVEFGIRHRIKYARTTAAICFTLLLAYPLIAILIYPHYLTYFSPLAGGVKHGWTRLSDSNVETGQEVKTLARYLKDHGEDRVVGVMVGGEFLKFYGIQFADFPGWYSDKSEDGDSSEESEDSKQGSTPEPGTHTANEGTTSTTIDSKYVAIGAWYLTEVDLSPKQKQIIDVYRNQQPEAMVGNSIFVFRCARKSESTLLGDAQ